MDHLLVFFRFPTDQAKILSHVGDTQQEVNKQESSCSEKLKGSREQGYSVP